MTMPRNSESDRELPSTLMGASGTGKLLRSLRAYPFRKGSPSQSLAPSPLTGGQILLES